MKKTAVEWLVKEVESISNSKIESKEERIELYNEAITKAKAMEKEQIMEAFSKSYGMKHDEKWRTMIKEQAEQYYNETFKSC
jgi:hypothetical protein